MLPLKHGAMKNWFLFIVMLLALGSCSGSLFDPANPYAPDSDDGHGMIVLGAQLENPFSVENMTKALDRIYPETKADRAPMDPTNIYVRFLPADDAQYESLIRRGVQMIDHPVDYEIVREGDWYHDPEIPQDDITWQYAVVKADFIFPKSVKYEILEQCYIPDNDPGTKSSSYDWTLVERTAYEISGNASMLSPLTKGEDDGKPEGDVLILDDRKETEEGVRGVMVSCNSFVKFGHAYTDENGHYKIDRSFADEPRYRITYKNKSGFNIGMNLIIVTASYSSLGKNPASGVDVHISKESERKLFSRCVVNNALYDYYKACDNGTNIITRPPANLRIWLFQHLQCSSCSMMQQGVLIDGSLVKKYLGEYSAILKMFLPDITLGLKGRDDYASIYAEAVHEASHASHFSQVGKEYWNNYITFIIKSFVTSGFVTFGAGTEENHGLCEVAEMWAYYMQSTLYNDRYPDSPQAFGTTFWFHPQVFMTLEEKGLGRYKIFAALTSDIKDKDQLQKKLISLYPEMKSTIKQAFGRYNL